MTKHDGKKPTLALALSGGAARCIAQLGVIQVLEEEGIPVDAIAGTSGGSLVGALYLDGRMSVGELIELAANTSWRKLFTPTIPRMGLVSSAGIHRFIKDHIRSRYIGDLDRPFAAVCADLHSGDKVVLTTGSLAQAVQASCSLPVVFTPTQVGDRTLVDGGVVSQLPVLAAKDELGAKAVVAVDVNYNASGPRKLNNVLNIAVHLAQMTARKNAISELPHAEVVINVDVRGIQLYDIQKHEELVIRGRSAARSKAGEIKRLLDRLG